MAATVYVTVNFDHGLPKIDDVKASLERRTGLNVQLQWPTSDVAIFAAKPFSYPPAVVVQGNEFKVQVGFQPWPYLTWALFATLEEFGGHPQVATPMPSFVNKKWSEKRWWQRFRA